MSPTAGVLSYPSKSGGAGHTVTMREAKDGTKYVVCTCPGGRFAWANDKAGRGCWAMKAARESLGIPAVA